MVNIGQDSHNLGSRDVLSSFSGLGFYIDVGPLFSAPGEVADLAVNSGVHVIVVSSQAARHLYLLP